MRRIRIAALVALSSAAVVIATLVVLVLENLFALLLVLALLVVGGTGVWIGLTHRGTARALGLAFSALALAGEAVALAAFGLVRELVVIVAATASFAFAGGFALRRVRRLDPGPAGRRRTRPVVGRKVLIMNPKSGGGKVERFGLIAEARRRGIEPVLLAPDDDLRTVAREAARTADVIGMAGGDGSQALVAQVAMEQSVAFVCVPAGTRNHLALDLGLDRDDVVSGLDAFNDGEERLIDLAFVNEQVFVNNVSLGIYAEIVQSEAYRDAKLETMETLLPELLGPRSKAFDLRYRDGDGMQHDSAQLILVSNNAYVLDRLAGMGSRLRLDTGLLGVVAAEISGPAQAAAFVTLEALGHLRRFAGWREWSAEEFEVDSSSPIAAGIDGEATVLDPPLHFRIACRALTVRIPPSALGLSPAAARPALERDSIRELWRITSSRR